MTPLVARYSIAMGLKTGLKTGSEVSSIDAESFLLKDIKSINVLYVKANEADDIVSALQQRSTLSIKILALLQNASFLSLESIQNGDLPNFNPKTPTYVLCNHGYLSELAALYLQVSGFQELYNVKGGLQALEKIKR